MRKLILFCLMASSILGLQSASAKDARTSAKHLELSCLFAKSNEYGKTQVEEMETYQTLNNDLIYATYNADPAFYTVIYNRTTREAYFLVRLGPSKKMGYHVFSTIHVLNNKLPADNLLSHAQLRGDKHGSVVCGLK